MATSSKTVRKVTTPEFRCSFLYAFKPQEPMATAADKTPKYGVTMLFDEAARKTEAFKNMVALAVAAAKEKFGDKIEPDGKGWFQMKGSEKPLKNPFRKGAEKPELEGYEGMVFSACTSKLQPGIVDGKLQRILKEDEFVSGHYARATITAYGYDKAGNVGVAFGLQNIQKTRDGKAFSGRTAAENDFDQVDDAFDKVEEGDMDFMS